MRKLLWRLSRQDCLTVQLLWGLGDDRAAVVFLLRATELLECRARSRDPEEAWQPGLADRELERGLAGGVS